VVREHSYSAKPERRNPRPAAAAAVKLPARCRYTPMQKIRTGLLPVLPDPVRFCVTLPRICP
jgi:hypothetical protein